jgi:putative membrane-bound dehydrogenase-like protein
MNAFRILVPLLFLLPPTALLRGQGFSPEDAVKRMKAPEGFSAKLVAAEPLVRQPVAIDFDDRGRLWVIQYLQYPNPAGLKRVKVDRYSRTQYDRVPEPPPRGPRGEDRLTILDSPDADGRMRRGKDFVNGLNLASGFAFGHGGVYVLQVPYLLFYPDRNGDDVPDGDPEVLLSGFGMEDAHSVANSLTWGPDGWLYGCQGSTVTAKIRNPANPNDPPIEFQQGVWRYHPLSKRFELFCEGGGNCWGLDFDADGNLLYSTNVGGHVMMHGLQGAYGWKFFGKHGPLHNPYAYGYFDHVPHENFHGGHVTVGGIIYQGDTFPQSFRGKYIAADLLGHAVYWHDVEKNGSTFRGRHGEELLIANDTWFAPSDVTMGPDGAIYVADWYDRRTAHPDPDADWDRSNGRIYKIEYGKGKPITIPDWKRLPSLQLVELLSSKNDWLVRRARRILAERRDPAVIEPLRKMALESSDEHLALQALWALYVSGGFDAKFAEKALNSSYPLVRSWTVRLLGDDNQAPPPEVGQLAEMAKTESSIRVRCQLACTAKRLAAPVALPIVQNLLTHIEDRNDPCQPLLLWWAVERHAVLDLHGWAPTPMTPISSYIKVEERAKAARREIIDSYTSAAALKNTLIQESILPRLIRRYAAVGTNLDDWTCAEFLKSVRSRENRDRLLAALDQGFADRAQPKDIKLSEPLDVVLREMWGKDCVDATLIRLRCRTGDQRAQEHTLELATGAKLGIELRLAMVQIIGEVGSESCVEPLLRLLNAPEPQSLHLAVLSSLARFDRPEIAATLLKIYPNSTGQLRSGIAATLLSRQQWAKSFLHLIDQGVFSAKEISVDQLRPLAAYQDKDLNDLVRKHWGNITTGTPEEKLAEVRRLNNDLRAGAGDVQRGKPLFVKHCATCHRLFDEGGNIGPDLTHANRKDRDYLLVSIVDPSAVIRKEYLSYVIQTKDGRALEGLILEQTPNQITLVNAKNEKTKIPRDQIETMQESAVSLMPENLLKALKSEEVRDLFAYLRR